MPTIGNFSVHIVVDGGEVEEYGVDKFSEDVVLCYITSVADQTFSIKVTNNYHEEVAFLAYVDGPWAATQFCWAGDSESMLGVRESDTIYRPFTFGTLQLTDHDDALRDKPQWSELGCIEVRVRRIVQGSHEPIAATNNTQCITDDPVHERSKKLGGHRIKLGAPQHHVQSTSTVTYIDPRDKPYVRFRFLYRPHGLLQAEGIIPLPPKPESSNARKRRNSEPHEETPSPAERREKEVCRASPICVSKDLTDLGVQERLKALRAEADRLAAELGHKKSGSPSIKRERSPICVPPSHNDGNIIDLTED
ncbi:hypothetical protein BXZ70DRAFT_1011290 [Cristinia sonorae]|uniref:DUF7918 domain-containing protein n=1 Tax=Cristinia sonorae TaxID=1940300 RepID=A0A8K0UGU1_9AGAR|nr:hypothetical protein BXZ70DRAFT_1011290 [Cristinia sonorae]